MTAEQKRFSVLYLGYGSNLSPTTVKQRCPESLYAGLARLDGWQWQINQTGYANIIPSADDHVYGSFSFLSPRDEAALDHSEGVPWLYEKHTLTVTRIKPDGSDGQQVKVMTYVDFRQVTPGTIDRDYVVWINKAIVDGLKCGLPSAYVEKYLRPCTPEEEMREIMMIRTTVRRDGGPKDQEQKIVDRLSKGGLGTGQMAGWNFGSAGGGLRDGSTA